MSKPSPCRGVPTDLLHRRPTSAALLAVALLAGCTITPAPSPSAPPVVTTPARPDQPQRQPELAAFKAQLSAHQAVPPADSPAQGELVAVLNRKTGLLQWRLSFSQLSGPVREAQFHSPAMGGEVAAPVLAVGRNIVSPYEGRAMLTRRQRADLLTGQWYVNLRTARWPEGELRGQLIEQR
ncbi:MAG: CHRD domain-containing protein [Burkholderiales bacterium]|nr:CHRD domain-containing protein [Burkholderiales bacterium]